ncbi:uncharacterized protein [Halyomorpha halys]|uniref:uncharacterized protein isoform X3 n=1 Tax=Halyomorpha halys TaxID=286706 RepID=UPI0034D165D7
MESLCRFCAKPGSGIDVFGEEGQKRNLYSKIKLCLPINENSSFKKLDSNMNHSPKNSSNETTEVSINDSKISTQNNDHSLKTNNFSGIKIEAVQSIPINMFQNLMDPEEVKKNGKRLSEESDKPDTAKKKERMTVCQYCRKWFPRSIITHHEKLHVKGSITFNCTSCNKDFSEADDFTNHSCEGD